MKIYNILEKPEYLKEVLDLELKEWGTYSEDNLTKKINKVQELLKLDNFAKLILLDEDKLIGFISLFPTDGEERTDLTPWYATMYVKKEYRGKGYSKILNDALLNYAKEKGYKRIYLKTDLINYYEKFGAVYLEDLNNGEKLYYIDLER
ncbi:MAG: GNAT family N-acetyltransferase [Bacilli bacterium]|nr:GNAT family N-acetyltransferase [Bacilli bacterium]